MPERDNRARNEHGGFIRSYIDRFRFGERNPVPEPLAPVPEPLAPAPEEPVIPEVQLVDLSRDTDIQTASEHNEASEEDWDISRKISALYREEYLEETDEEYKREIALADEFNYRVNCECSDCAPRREEAMRIQREREKERRRLDKASQKSHSKDNDIEELIDAMRICVNGERMDKLEYAQSADKLWEYLGKKGVDSQAYFMTLMSYMPDQVFDRMTGLPGKDNIDPLIKYLLASLSVIGRMDNPELRFGRLIERAYGSAAINRVAGAAGLAAYAYAREKGFADDRNLLLTQGNEAALKKQIEALQKEHQERMDRLQPLNELLKEPLRYGIEIECHAKLIPYGSIPDVEEIMGLAGWEVGYDGNKSYEYKSNPTDDVELLGYELELMERLGVLAFDTELVMDDGLRLAHGIHLTTGGLRFAPNNDYSESMYADINFLHHTDEATGFMTAFDYGMYRLDKQTAMIKGETLSRVGWQLRGSSYGGEQRTFIMYDREKFMEGLRMHAKKAQALAGYQLLPGSVRKRINREDIFLSEGNPDKDFAREIRREPKWQEYCDRIERVIEENIDNADSHPLIKGLAAEWVRYKGLSSALFAAVYVPYPGMNWGDDGRNVNARPALYNSINSTFRTPEDYFKDPEDLPWTVNKHGRERTRDIRLGRQYRFVNLVHGMRTIDSMFSENVENAIGKRYDTDI